MNGKSLQCQRDHKREIEGDRQTPALTEGAERVRERETDSKRDRDSERETDRKTETVRERQRETNRQ